MFLCISQKLKLNINVSPFHKFWYLISFSIPKSPFSFFLSLIPNWPAPLIVSLLSPPSSSPSLPFLSLLPHHTSKKFDPEKIQYERQHSHLGWEGKHLAWMMHMYVCQYLISLFSNKYFTCTKQMRKKLIFMNTYSIIFST